jgi:AAA ATPase domain
MTTPAPSLGLDECFAQLIALNPFLDNRINHPSASDVDVADIHQTAFARLTSLAHEALAARRGIGVVLWGEAGVGKSHLLSRFARWAAADNRAYFIYLHNLQAAPERLPAALLRAAVGLLTLGQGRRWRGTPLWKLVRGWLLEAVGGVVGRYKVKRLHEAHTARIERLAASNLPGANPIDRTVYEVLFQFFRSTCEASEGRDDGTTAALAVRWLSGEALDAEETSRIGARPEQAGEAGALADNEQVKQILVALSRLAAAAGRPFVLAFDQVDNLEDGQFAALARFLEALIDASPNLLAVTAGVQSTLFHWRQTRLIQDSAWDRLAQFELGLQRLTAEQARQLIQARLTEFLAPFAGLGPIYERLRADPLFPLGAPWYEHHFQDKMDIRPRDVVNRAREGWRRQQEALAHIGGPEWLAGWTGRAADNENGKPPTPDESTEAVDSAVGDVVTAHAAAVRRNPADAPPDADRMAALFHVLLTQCGERAGASGLRRLPTADKGPRPPYDLEFTQSGAIGGPLRTGLLFVGVSRAISAAAFLRRLVEAPSLPQRLFLITDERMKLPIGAKGATYLKELQERPGQSFERRELSVTELADLEALQAAVLQARSGDLEAEPRPGRICPISEREVIESHHRRGRYRACPLLRDLLTPPLSFTVQPATTETVA